MHGKAMHIAQLTDSRQGDKSSQHRLGAPTSFTSCQIRKENAMSNHKKLQASSANESSSPPRSPVQQRVSVTELLARLTTPTAASRNKMRESPKSDPSMDDSGSKKGKNSPSTRNGNWVPISRPMPVIMTNSQLSKGARHQDRLRYTRRKAPSPPTSQGFKAESPQSIPTTLDQPNSPADSQAARHSGSHSDGTTGPATIDTPASMITANGSSKHSSPSNSAESLRLEPVKTSSADNLTERSSASPVQSKSPLSSQIRRTPRQANPSKLTNSPQAVATSSTANGAVNISQPMQKPLRSDATRRLSAPAPSLNVTKPRAMSRAGLPLNTSVSGSGNRSLPTSPTLTEPSRRSPLVNGSRKASDPTHSAAPLNSSRKKLPSPPLPQQQVRSVSANATLKKPSSSLADDTGFDYNSATTVEELRQCLAKMRDHNDSLKQRNRHLKTRLDEAVSTRDQMNIELSVSEASRNVLEQQVAGYEILHDKTSKSLQRSEKLVKILKFNMQELKMTLEEKDMEIYNLQRRLKNGACSPQQANDDNTVLFTSNSTGPVQSETSVHRDDLHDEMSISVKGVHE